MKKIILVIALISIALMAFAVGPNEVQATVNAAHTSQEVHTRTIAEMEARLNSTSNNVEFRRLNEARRAIGNEMNWQLKLFNDSNNVADKQEILTKYKELEQQYNQAVKELEEFQARFK